MPVLSLDVVKLTGAEREELQGLIRAGTSA